MFPDGKIEQLLGEASISNGVQGYNSNSINVAYVGGIDSKGRPVDNRTKEQKTALTSILRSLKLRYPNAHIMGHRDIWGKDSRKWKKMCPCFDAEKEYAYLDDIKFDKYEDAGNIVEYEPKVPNSPTKPVSYIDKLKELIPWRKK